MYVYDIWSQNTRQLLYLPVLYIYIFGGEGGERELMLFEITHFLKEA